jgi:predicted nucleic acid-binding Zn ribbon protein
MNRYRYFCRNCWDKEHKQVVKEWTGGPQEKCEFCKQDMELQKQLVGGFGKKGLDVSSGWVKA